MANTGNIQYTGNSRGGLTNDLAGEFYSAIITAMTDALQQMRHIRKRAPFAVTGQMFFRIRLAGPVSDFVK